MLYVHARLRTDNNYLDSGGYAMSETFGFRLKRFALALDIVDDEIFHRLWSLILSYVKPHLKPTYWALLSASDVNNMPGLTALECSLASKPSFNLRTASGSYNGLAAYSYAEGKPLWIVADQNQALGPDTPLQDEWSDATHLPQFDRAGSDIRTVILVPLISRGRKLGLLDLQSSTYQELTARIKEELTNIAATLSVLLPLYEANEERREHTIEAINLHAKALSEEQWPPLTKPQIFVASSDRADPEIMGVIREILDDFTDRMHVRYWRECSESGNINQTMLRAVYESQFGLCYFSEPFDDPEQKSKYRDNPNVLFEAGLLQSLTNLVTSVPSGWIPVRESMSLPVPFDFAQERMILVQRSASNDHPNLDALRAALQARLTAMLD
jgi:hypothetical protein